MKKRGDTLIEVLFAFAIIGTVIGVAFSGALNSFRAVLSAQDRTQATFAVKYQAEALKTYRESLDFTAQSGPNFIGSVPDNSALFCMDKVDTDGQTYWEIKTDLDRCNQLAKELAPNLSNPELKINATKNLEQGEVIATITLVWDSRSSVQKDTTTNTVVLTKGVRQ